MVKRNSVLHNGLVLLHTISLNTAGPLLVFMELLDRPICFPSHAIYANYQDIMTNFVRVKDDYSQTFQSSKY